MIGNKKILAVIPARGGSKGVKNKNIRDLAGQPLIAWTIIEAKKSKYIDRLILSSEDPHIIEVAKKYGCEVPFVRPMELAQDNTPGIDPVLHAIQEIPGYDYVLLLQPTSPLRTVDDIDACLEKCDQAQAPACVSFKEAEESPYWMYHLEVEDRIAPLLTHEPNFVRRQDLPIVYLINGAIYVANTAWLRHKKTFISNETLGFVMSLKNSIDIDSELDLKTAEYYKGNG